MNGQESLSERRDMEFFNFDKRRGTWFGGFVSALRPGLWVFVELASTWYRMLFGSGIGAAFVARIMTSNGTTRRKMLLVAEDDETTGALLCEALQQDGYTTYWAKDGIDALNYILESRPDGVVLDLVLPKLNGYEICGMVRKSRAVQWTPIVILSGCVEHRDKMQAFELGADDYVTKPFRIEELLARVEAVLHRNADKTYPTPFLPSYNA